MDKDQYVKMKDIQISREEDAEAAKTSYYWILYQNRHNNSEIEMVIKIHPFEFRNKLFSRPGMIGIKILNWKKINMVEYKLFQQRIKE